MDSSTYSPAPLSLIEADVPAVRVENITKTFRKGSTYTENGNRQRLMHRLFHPRGRMVTVLNVSDLEIRRGEIYGVLGPNGSGKSTLIRIISTLLLPDSGSISVFGRDVVKESLEVQRMLNRVSADAAFFRKLSAMENLLHTARVYGLPVKSSMPRIREILSRLDLSNEKMDSEMHELSRGMQQKVALARAFLTSPVLMLLDEPTTGLDLKSKKEVQNFIMEVRRDHDATILLTTHDMAEAEALCDRIAILDGGKVVEVGTSAELKQRAHERGKLEKEPGLEEAFVALTGHSMADAEAEHQLKEEELAAV